MKKTIKIACKGAGELSLDLLTPVQDDFKILTQEHYEELKTQILEEGFSSPLYVWEDESDAQIKILDGHQRYECLHRMEKEGYKIPQIPVVYVEADDIKQAIRKLAGFASQYGTIQDDGFVRLMKKYEIDFDDLVRKINIPQIDFNAIADKLVLDINPEVPKFEQEVTEEKNSTNSALPESQIKQVQLFFDGKDHELFVKMSDELMESRGVMNLSDLIMGILLEAYSTQQ